MAVENQAKGLRGLVGRGRTNRPRVRVLTASAKRIDLKDRQENRKMLKLRQGWQSEAWAYYNSIGELRYGTNYLANCFARMRLFPAAYPTGGEDDDPVPLDDIEDVPPEVMQACKEAQRDLGNGRLAMSALLHSYSTNITVTGECFLLGEQDESGGPDTWSIRSTEEIVVQDEKYKLRELPSDSGSANYIELDPDKTTVSRIWIPHPMFRALAISPCRAILDDMESLLILRRMIRASGRSRLASRGIAVFPLEMEIKTPEDDSEDPETMDFLADMTEAMEAGLADEGVASAAMPIVAQGPAEHIDKIRFIDFASKFDAEAKGTREELVGIIGTGLDLPAEVVTGKADLNHWSAWAVEDDTFRAHVQPHVIAGCDSLTAAFLRPYLEIKGVPPEWIHRIIWWYDPSELIVHPDRSKDALDLFNAEALGAPTVRREMGFDENDAPSKDEIEFKQLQHVKNIPANLLLEFARRMDPTLVVPAILTPGTIPGIKPGGVDVGAPGAGAPTDGPTAAAPAGTPGIPVSSPPAPAPAAPAPSGPPAEPVRASAAPPPPNYRPEDTPEKDCGNCHMFSNGVCWGYGNADVDAHFVCDSWASEPITAASAAPSRGRNARLSKRLSSIDRDLRARLQTAANVAMRRKLEQAGARVRSALINHPNETVKAAIAHSTNERLTAAVGEVAIAAAGMDVNTLISDDWSALREQFMGWTSAAQEQALATAMQLGELDAQDAAVLSAKAAMERNVGTAWESLQNALEHLGNALLYSPDPNVGPTAWAEVNPDTIVPTGVIRAALGVAGGAPSDLVPDFGVIPGSSSTIALGAPIGQVGTGATVTELLKQAGAEQESYEWEHGPSSNPFEPHDALDGTIFKTFDSEALANTGDFPDNAFLFPGDHTGCTCDVTPMWVSPSEANSEEEGGETDAPESEG